MLTRLGVCVSVCVVGCFQYRALIKGPRGEGGNWGKKNHINCHRKALPSERQSTEREREREMEKLTKIIIKIVVEDCIE